MNDSPEAWFKPREDIAILEATRENADRYGKFGSSMRWLKAKHIEALQSGKMLMWRDSDYVTFVVLGDIDFA